MRFIKIFIVMAILLATVSCSKNIDSEDIYARVYGISEEKITVELTNTTSEEILHNNTFTLEKLENDEWVNVPFVYNEKLEGDKWVQVPFKHGEIFVTIGYNLNKGETDEININFEKYFGVLEKGEYRINRRFEDANNIIGKGIVKHIPFEIQ